MLSTAYLYQYEMCLNWYHHLCRHECAGTTEILCLLCITHKSNLQMSKSQIEYYYINCWLNVSIGIISSLGIFVKYIIWYYQFLHYNITLHYFNVTIDFISSLGIYFECLI